MTSTDTIRTEEEILQHIEAVKDRDFFGFETGDLLEFVSFEKAKPYLKDGVTSDEWPAPEKGPREKLVDYMEFAFGKAHGKRGLSANRSISHMLAWTWLFDDGLYNEVWEMYDNDYHAYGLPILRHICERVGIDPKEHGDY